jgi:hypothetical protein
MVENFGETNIVGAKRMSLAAVAWAIAVGCRAGCGEGSASSGSAGPNETFPARRVLYLIGGTFGRRTGTVPSVAAFPIQEHKTGDPSM